MRSFDYFVQKIPPNAYKAAKAVFSKHIAIFIPDQYVFDRKMDVEEYHFVLCFTTPPVANIGDQEHKFKKGSLICLAPGDDILVHSDTSVPAAQYITICVQPEFMSYVYGELGFPEKLTFNSLDSGYSRYLLEALDAFIHEVQYKDQSSPLMLSSLENRVVIQLIRDAKCLLQSNEITLDSIEGIVRYAINYIETYYASNISVKDISDAIFISPSYLQKIFRKVVGKTPYQYIMVCRHRQAKHMLATTKLSMEEVARQCGFVNNAHFSTAFKHLEGISPLSFRKSMEV